MSQEMPAGKIGSLDVRLAPQSGNTPRYERRYVPVTPASREIVGSDDKVAPDSTVAEWHIDDWSGGEGDLRWRNADRYDTSDGLGPVSDGSGVTVIAAVEQTNDTGGGTVMEDAGVIARAAGKLLTADDCGGTLFAWNDTNEEWDVHWDIGGAGSDDVTGIAAVTATEVYVADSGGDIYEVKAASDATHYTGWGATPRLVSYQGRLYGLDGNDLYDIDTTTTDTRTLKVDVSGLIDRTLGAKRRMTTGDVGPIWYAPMNDGRTYIYEYNQADDVGYVVGELPKDVQPYDIAFHNGIYFVAFRYAAGDALSGDAHIYYQVGGQRGVAGPLRAPTGITASKPVALAGVVGDRLYCYYDGEIWAYDLSSGGISMAARDVSEPAAEGFMTYGSSLFLSTGSTAYRVNLDEYDDSDFGTLTTGRYDFGYLGLNKTLTKVTVACEEALAASDEVGIAYAVDGGSFTTLAGTMGAGETTKTWTVSTNASTVRGVDFEFNLRILAGSSASSPKVVSVTAEAVGSESRLEWVLRLDTGDWNEQSGQATVDGLKTLKTGHDVVEFVDPWQVLATTADETFDVTVEEAYLPDVKAGSDRVATVRLRTVATV